MSRRGLCLLPMLLAVGLPILADAAEPPRSPGDQHFLARVQPLLNSRCASCHGAEKAEGGLRLDSRAAALRGGDTGPALVPGKPEASLLFLAVQHSDENLQMPPKDKLAATEIAALRLWIADQAPWPTGVAASAIAESGAKGDAWTDPQNPIARLFGGQRLDLWSLQPVRRPPVPAIDPAPGDAWACGAIDALVRVRWQREGIMPPPPADARTLRRRLAFDLSGLPPTAAEVEAFAATITQHGLAAAMAGAVDDLLARPQFGEHFARLWLDVVRYSDSNGFDWDEYRPQAWRYRDYVVRSLNQDKPYDQFLVEQLAGDELLAGPPRDQSEQDMLLATGYLRLGPHDNAAGLFAEQDRSRAELLADLTETTGAAWLGLTLNCCRCHDHKYDPLSHADHFRFRAFFAAVEFANSLPLDLAAEQEAIRAHNQPLERDIAKFREELEKTPEAAKDRRQQIQERIATLERQRRTFTHGLCMTDSKAPAAIHVLFQGNHQAPRDEVQPGFFSVWTPEPAALQSPPNPATTGRRLTLARWIAAPANPLTARVFVNRVWQHLMGQPLVATPNDFGLAGSRPIDPALLDWLAAEFVAQDWSLKRLVRLIVTSATYQQAPRYAEALMTKAGETPPGDWQKALMTSAGETPPGDWQKAHDFHRSPRRLTAEQLRDSMLQVSGLLTSKADGPPIWPDLPREVLEANPAFLDDNAEKTKAWYPSPKAEQYCRSLFLIHKRNTRVPLLEAFDLPENSVPCARREVSTVAPQALMLLNNPLALAAAESFAKRVQAEAGPGPAEQIRHAFRLALQRPPEQGEVDACLALLHRRSLAELCRVILNLNEFAYVD